MNHESMSIRITRATDPEDAPVRVTAVPRTETVRLSIDPLPTSVLATTSYRWNLPDGADVQSSDASGPEILVYLGRLSPREYPISVTMFENGQEQAESSTTLYVLPVAGASEVTQVSLQRAASPFTPDVALWMLIQRSTRALSFNNYQRALDTLLLGGGASASAASGGDSVSDRVFNLHRRRFLPFNDTDAYRFLKIFTEAFVLANVDVALVGEGASGRPPFGQQEIVEAAGRISTGRDQISPDALADYLEGVITLHDGDQPVQTLPYLALVRQKLREYGIDPMLTIGENEQIDTGLSRGTISILQERLTAPILLELIWSYWQEEGMLVQTINTIARRFQNIRGPYERDPLANFEIDPLRPLNNLLWGYIQDEQHRLTVVRRTYEYDHHYGISLVGKAIPRLRSADSRSRFIESFHNLLSLCTRFYQQDDDTTVIADGFPILNALREVHLELSQSAHNQFGDMPSTTRQEMLMQQWLLARPEFREFLPTRIMVAYPEPWMDRVDAMKHLQGWSDTSVLQFHYLATYGEELLLSIRYGAWNHPDVQRESAANWTRFWRNAITNYIHSYRAVTGVDLSAELTSSDRASDRYLQPAIHLSRRIAAQQGGRALPAPRNGVVVESRPMLPRRSGRKSS